MKRIILIGFIGLMPISAYANNVTEVLFTSVVKGHADTAGDVRSLSYPVVSPCGDSSGLSAQTGILGGGLATIPETCRAFRLQMLETVSPDATSTKLARITYYVGWFPRLLLHVASFGVLN